MNLFFVRKSAKALAFKIFDRLEVINGQNFFTLLNFQEKSRAQGRSTGLDFCLLFI